MEERVPTPDSRVTVSGLGYQRSGGEPSTGSRQRHQPQQAVPPPQGQDRAGTPSFQQLQGEHPPQDLGGPSGPGYQQQPGEYQDQGTPSGPGYPRHDEDRSTGEHPAHGQDGYHNQGYSHAPGEPDVSGAQNDGPRQYGSEDGDRREGDRVTYREDSRRSAPGGWWSRVTKSSKQRSQNRHSSPADMLEDKKHPIRGRRVISAKERGKRKSAKAQVVNPMGMRLRRQLPGFDFATFAEQLNEDELKTFLPSQPIIPQPDYSDDEEEEEEEPEARGDDEEEHNEEEVDRQSERRPQEMEEPHEEEERKESDVKVELEEERVATDVITVDKARPKSRKSMRREFAKEEVGAMKEELVDLLS